MINSKLIWITALLVYPAQISSFRWRSSPSKTKPFTPSVLNSNPWDALPNQSKLFHDY